MVTIHTRNEYMNFNGGFFRTTIMVQREDARLGTIATSVVNAKQLAPGEPYLIVDALVKAFRFMGEDVKVTGDMARDFA